MSHIPKMMKNGPPRTVDTMAGADSISVMPKNWRRQPVPAKLDFWRGFAMIIPWGIS